MSDSITATGIQHIEIAMPEIRRIFVATFAAIVLVFLWILHKELRKRYGEIPQANLADTVGGMLALPASIYSPPKLSVITPMTGHSRKGHGSRDELWMPWGRPFAYNRH